MPNIPLAERLRPRTIDEYITKEGFQLVAERV